MVWAAAPLPKPHTKYLRPSLKGVRVKTWRLLMAMIKHEVHHRSQLAVYLSLMGIQPPKIYGLSPEEVISILTG